MMNSKTSAMLSSERPWSHTSNLSTETFGRPINADLMLSVTPGLQDTSSQLVCSMVTPLPHAWVTVPSLPERETGFPKNNLREFSN